MSYSQENGYIPTSINALMNLVRENVNTQFSTTYTTEQFLGTNFYKFYYALIQELQKNEVKTSEIFLKLQQYFAMTNERILRPQTTPQGIVDKILSDLELVASIKPMISEDAGKIHVCVDVDSLADGYAAKKIEINTLLSGCIVAGVVSEGTESTNITLSNGQVFAFKYSLPDKHATLLRLTLTLSVNNSSVVLSVDDIKELLLENIQERYSLGKDFEPQRYFSVVDAPWASEVLLEYSLDDGETWLDDVYTANFDDLLTFALEDITVVED